MTLLQEPVNRRATRLRFGDFELELDSGELSRAGAAVKLQPRPARVLELLAGRAGEVVSREEIRRAVWGEGTYVDFDLALNFCILQVRRALGDSARLSRFVATIPRRGYRFLAPVEVVCRESGLLKSSEAMGREAGLMPAVEEADEEEATPETGAPAAPRWALTSRRSLVAVAGSLLLIVLGLPGLPARQGRLLPAATATSPASPQKVSSAHQLYLEGQYLLASGKIDQARALFEEAATLDPQSSPVFAALSQTLLGTLRPAREIVPAAAAAERRALELDPMNFVAHVARGQRLFQYEYDWRGAEREFRYAIQLDGRSAEGHFGLANVLAQQGRHDEALQEARRALALEPERQLSIHLGRFLYLARRYDEAIAQTRRTIALGLASTHDVAFPRPAFRRAYLTVILSELARGDSRAALAAAREEARAFEAPLPASLTAFWRRAQQDAAAFDAAHLGQAVIPAIELGQYDHALDLLSRQCEERAGYSIPFLRVNPIYDPLRGLPRFRALLRCAKESG